MGIPVCRVGLVGAGVVGGGVAEVLLGRGALLSERAGVRLELVRVAEKDAARARAAGVPDRLLVDDFKKVVDDPEVDVVVELIGGKGVAHDVVRSALAAGKPVVTANKALLAEKGLPLFALAREKRASLAFEASVCGGIPILLALREGLVANRFQSLLGVVNGTCNYILTEMTTKGLPFEVCLKEAQRLGYAEADPTTDIDGFDSGHKLALLSALAFETWIDFPALPIEGIRGVGDVDIRLAGELGYVLKLLACARPETPPPDAGAANGSGAKVDADADPGRLFLSVHPALLKRDHPLANLPGSMNGVALSGDVVMEGAYFGRGAGRFPTASAVVSDLVQVARARAGQGAGAGDAPSSWTPRPAPRYRLAPMEDYRARYFLRFTVADRPGVLAKMSAALGNRGVSIAEMRQWEGDDVHATLTFLTHTAREGDVQAALAEIRALPFIQAKPAPTLLRIEE